jgi:hypothetical protein
MATTHAPGTGVGPGDAGGHGRRGVVVAAVVLALGVIVVPFGVRSLDHDGARAPAAPPTTTPSPAPAQHRQPGTKDAGVGPRGDLPALLPASRAGLLDGVHVRLGDVTTGALRRTPSGGWQVLVRWNGRLQPVPIRGPVSIGGSSSVSWVSAEGLLYTRVATARPHRFRVYAWDPQGGSAYTPPSLVAVTLGPVCFDAGFTTFGTCAAR